MINRSHLESMTPSRREALAHLGEPSSRSLIATPALLCDIDLLKSNLLTMARTTSQAGVSLRPHVKSHKSAAIARMQLEHGAVGLSFAKLSEAEAIVEALTMSDPTRRVSVLLTSPLAGEQNAARATALAEHCELIVVIDDVAGVEELNRTGERGRRRISALCDVDVGLGRTGVTGIDQAKEVSLRIANSPWIDFAGVQGYGGQLQHMANRDDRREATRTAIDKLATVVAGLEEEGLQVPIRSGGGTGTALLDIECGVLNELQAGSYVFMDREYRDALGDADEGSFAQSLVIETTVISSNQSSFVTVDAGLKSMATDAGSPVVIGHESSSQFHFFGDEHGLVTFDAAQPIRRGDRLTLIPPHCDPTVDRYDLIFLVRGDVLIDVVKVTARGCSQ